MFSIEVDPGFIDAADDPIITTDVDGRIQDWNLAATRALGYSVAEIIGQSVDVLTPTDYHAELRTLLARATGGERSQRAELELIRKDRRRVRVSLSLLATIDDDGGAGMLLVFRESAPTRLVLEQLAVYDRRLDERTQRLLGEITRHDRETRAMLERLSGHTLAITSRGRDEQELLLQLTVHESQLLRLLAQGYSNAQIGRELGLSAGTVRNQLTRLYLKLGVTDRAHAAARGVALGLTSNNNAPSS